MRVRGCRLVVERGTTSSAVPVDLERCLSRLAMPLSPIGTARMSKSKDYDPAAIIPNRLIDSAAYASLKHSSTRLLQIIARQYNGRNNGKLQAAFSYCAPRGFGSQNTLREAISDLISHGFIVRTRSRGTANGKNIWALYAITWRNPDKSKGIYFDGFKKDAWELWIPPLENSGCQKLVESTVRNCNPDQEVSAESGENRPPETDDYE